MASSAALLGELVVADQRVETVPPAVVDVPDEGAVVEQLAVLLEEAVAQIVVERGGACLGEELSEHAVVPVVAEGGCQQCEEAVAGGGLGAYGRDADDAVLVGVGKQLLATLHPFALLAGELHFGILLRGPAVPEKAGDRDLQYGGVGAERAVGGPLAGFVPDHRAAGVAVEDPLGGVVGVGEGKAVGV